MPTLEELASRIAQLETSAGITTTLTGQIDDVTRQLQRLQGGSGLLEPQSALSAWDETPPFVASGTQPVVTYIGQAAQLLAGRNVTFTRLSNTPFLRLDIGSNMMNADYVVDAAGFGTHTTLFGTTGALEAAIATGTDAFIWVCSTHTENVASTHSLTALAANQEITIQSGDRSRAQIVHTNATGSLMKFDNSSGAGSRLNFSNIAFVCNNGATTQPLLNSTAGKILPAMEWTGVEFRSASSATWVLLLDGYTATLTMGHWIMTSCSGDGVKSIIALQTSSASNSLFVLDRCEFRNLTTISRRTGSTDVDPGGTSLGTARGIYLRNCIFQIDSYAWKRTYNTTMQITGCLFWYTGTANLFQIGTAGTTNPADATISGNVIHCGTAGASAVIVSSGAGTASNIAIVGNEISGPGSGTAIQLDVAAESATDGYTINNSYRDWATNVGGTGASGAYSGVDHGSLIGLADDDHTQYTLKSTLTTTGDIYYASAASTPARLGIGAATTILGVTAGIPAWQAQSYIDHGSLGGLLDDDHTQYTLKATLTTTGDTYYASAASTPARLAVGGATTVLGVTAGLPAWQAQTYIDHGSVSGLADDDHALYLLASDATNRTTFATNWLDLTDTGATTLHSHVAVTAHNILSLTHGDSLAASVVRGDLMVGNSTPAWARVAAGTAGSVLFGDGTDTAWTVSPRIAGYIRIGSTSVPTNTTAGDLTVIRLLIGDAALTAGLEFQLTGDYQSSGYARVGSLTAPTNTTAGDFTVTRLKVVEGAFGTGVDFSVTGDGALSGFLRVGSETAPTNITAGDLTVARLIVGDAALTSGLEFQLTGDYQTSGYARIGSLVAPTNVTAGDFTTIRSFIGTTAAFGTEIGLQVATLGARFTGVLTTDAAVTLDRVDIAVISGTPRIIWEDAASATVWEIDNSAGVFRMFNPGTVRSQWTTAGYAVLGWGRYGSLTAPTNVTAGDLTVARLIIPNAVILHSAVVQLGGPVVIPTGGVLRLSDADDSNYVGLRSPAIAQSENWVIHLPADDPVVGDALVALAVSSPDVTTEWKPASALSIAQIWTFGGKQ